MTNDVGSVLRTIDRWVKALSTETIPVIETFGRIASRSVKAPRSMPQWDVSALDGFVVEGQGSTFLPVGTQEMGESPIRLKEGQAVFVPTGAPLPRNGRFVMAEHIVKDEAVIRTETEGDERKEWEKGSWLKKGASVMEKGQAITAEAMENLSLAGIAIVEVYRQVQVAVMTTGDEIRSGVIPDSNRYLLSGLIQGDRGHLHHIPTAPDLIEEMAEAIRAALSSDMLVITGGTARGKKDVTREALKEVKARFLVDRPSISPGRTMAFGLLGTMPFFLLPGNPKAIKTLYETIVRRCLTRLQGVREERKD